MIKPKLYLLLSSALLGQLSWISGLQQPQQTPAISLMNQRITVNNRVVAKVNGKAISVMDLMKKLDVVFYREYPQYADSVPARYQFYSINWRSFLEDMIDAELILANAEELKVTVSDGEVRQELEQAFGPNVITTIDKLNMTYKEALKMVQSDLIVKTMTGNFVHAKAMQQVNPKTLRIYYEKWAKVNPIPASWTYQVISIRTTSQLQSIALADQIYTLLTREKIPTADLLPYLKQKRILDSTTKVTVSEEYKREEGSLSKDHKEILARLQNGTFSSPIAQVSRVDRSTVYRIFYLKEFTKESLVPFASVQEKLKEELMDQALEEESLRYRKKLRERFGIPEDYLSQMIPKDFQPFSLS